ncbi:Mho1p NDAI_0C02970 [Naumovozyma dairenensis CBS 421]|uniref:AmmeMemoRadiSam system protein B n=1 Tax=Naumovozyma dairenensis (strain ATCC 10597 / BCRC 20456 / CBS 421 / NBRC 0211 / NRRL Y-12639) TaxID=1071378 RepID=G0W846_NAUDC|nr:hypothetical protein NDAI_0C02970 [Naumovozyma dairenensis CBS 421]CCD23957.1 hypothetical protein NDAI_0C02970 [Naumovozyma dairenensis CBS 421]
MSLSRPATHAGSWYSRNAAELSSQLQTYLNNSKKPIVKNSRIIISPHAGYRYCGSTMAYSYASLDLNENIKRIFILGPSHHIFFSNEIFVSAFDSISTPLGDLKVDKDLCSKLVRKKISGKKIFSFMNQDVDTDEHSLEMQFSMLVQTLNWRKVPLDNVKVIPMMVSHNTKEFDMSVGKILSEYLNDPSNLFIISSDFCHWGRRFEYTGYVGSEDELKEATEEETEIEMLTSRSKLKHHQIPIWKSIEILDKHAMRTLSDTQNSDRYDAWKQYLEITGNTICGERPIGVVLAALAYLPENSKVTFEWPHYSQSSQVQSLEESSVSYTSGYVTIQL